MGALVAFLSVHSMAERKLCLGCCLKRSEKEKTAGLTKTGEMVDKILTPQDHP